MWGVSSLANIYVISLRGTTAITESEQQPVYGWRGEYEYEREGRGFSLSQQTPSEAVVRNPSY